MIFRAHGLSLACLCLLLALVAGYAPAAPADATTRAGASRGNRDLPLHVRQRAELLKKYQTAMEQVAVTSEMHGQPEEAARIRAMLQETPPQGNLPRAVRPELPITLPANDKFREAQIRGHQTELARGLYLLARQTLNAGLPSAAYDLVRETVAYDSDHKMARRILGFVQSDKEWVTPFEAQMKREKKVWNTRFGWLPVAQEDRYKNGERYFRQQWMSAAKEAEIRRDFKFAWEIRTEHFEVLTNHSLERGVELATKLEDFHGVCVRTLAGFFQSPEQLKQLFEGPNLKKTAAPGLLKVNYYRTRDEYLKVVKGLTQQQVEMTKGIFFPNEARAYFFDDPDNDDDSTLYHEATHLLLSGSRPQTKPLGQRSDFWVIEGIACYMESFHRDGDKVSLGDPTQLRMRAAQHHLVVEKYYVPLREFSEMGMQAFQTDKNIRKNYSQSAALSHFFIHYEDGKYRDALVEYLTQIYSSRATIRNFPKSMEELTNVKAADLDAEYTEYLTGLDTVPDVESP